MRGFILVVCVVLCPLMMGCAAESPLERPSPTKELSLQEQMIKDFTSSLLKSGADQRKILLDNPILLAALFGGDSLAAAGLYELQHAQAGQVIAMTELTTQRKGEESDLYTQAMIQYISLIKEKNYTEAKVLREVLLNYHTSGITESSTVEFRGVINNKTNCTWTVRYRLNGKDFHSFVARPGINEIHLPMGDYTMEVLDGSGRMMSSCFQPVDGVRGNAKVCDPSGTPYDFVHPLVNPDATN